MLTWPINEEIMLFLNKVIYQTMMVNLKTLQKWFVAIFHILRGYSCSDFDRWYQRLTGSGFWSHFCMVCVQYTQWLHYCSQLSFRGHFWNHSFLFSFPRWPAWSTPHEWRGILLPWQNTRDKDAKRQGITWLSVGFNSLGKGGYHDCNMVEQNSSHHGRQKSERKKRGQAQSIHPRTHFLQLSLPPLKVLVLS